MSTELLQTQNISLPIEKISSGIDSFVSVCMLVITIIGVVFVFNYRQHQKEAIYGFYANMRTFLTAFSMYIHAGNDEPMEWMYILGKTKNETTDKEREKIRPVVEFCKSFFSFLSTAPNQIPPSRRKDIIATWENSFSILRIRLVDIINYDIQAFPDWYDPTEVYKELNFAVTEIRKLIGDLPTEDI